jgi:hypothetical protein
MLMVAPSGMANDAIEFDTPSSSSVVLRLMGIVAFELEVEKAKIGTRLNFLKNCMGESPLRTFNRML